MFSFFAKLLDRLIIRGACAVQPRPGTYPAYCAEAHALLQDPDFFASEVAVPSDLKWTSQTDFQFSSAIASPFPENRIVFGKLFRSEKDGFNRPTIVLIHGWNDEIGYVWRHRYQVKRFLKHGLNVAMLELPFHLQRRPRGAGVVNDFLSEDLQSTVLAARQAVADIRALLAWLEAQGCGHMGLLGVSLGGWLTGLVSCHDQRVKFAVLNVPVADMELAVKNLPFCEPLRRSLQSAENVYSEFEFDRLNLRSYQPKVARENMLIIEAVHDLFAAKSAIEELWQKWGQPEIWRVNHAHISGLFWPSLLKRQVDWVAQKCKLQSR